MGSPVPFSVWTTTSHQQPLDRFLMGWVGDFSIHNNVFLYKFVGMVLLVDEVGCDRITTLHILGYMSPEPSIFSAALSQFVFRAGDLQYFHKYKLRGS